MLTHWPMRRLLAGDDGAPVATPAAWQERADAIRATFLRTLGPRPASQTFRSVELGATERDGGVTRTLVRIDVGDDWPMEAWLLEPVMPPPSGSAPAQRVALALHQTTNHGKDEVAGLAGSPDLAYGKELAQRGWTVLAPDQLAIERRFARGLRPFDTARLYEKFPQWSAVGKTLADAQMALDAMAKLPQTAGRAVSVIGHSLGAHSALFLAAADPRPVAFVSNCGLYPFADSAGRAHFFRDHWYIYFKDAALKRSVVEGPQPLWDFHEIAALCAPRRLMVLSSIDDPLVASAKGLARTSQELFELYEFLGARAKLATIFHNEDHSFRPWHRAAAYTWMEA